MKFNAKQAAKASSTYKLTPVHDKYLDKLYKKELNRYIESIEFQILLYASWGVFWTLIPVHFEPKIFNDARKHFESLGFKYKMEYGVNSFYVDIEKSKETYYESKRDWLITWHGFES